MSEEGVRTVPCDHAELVDWVEEMAALCQPETVVWCDGSQGGV